MAHTCRLPGRRGAASDGIVPADMLGTVMRLICQVRSTAERPMLIELNKRRGSRLLWLPCQGEREEPPHLSRELSGRLRRVAGVGRAPLVSPPHEWNARWVQAGSDRRRKCDWRGV